MPSESELVNALVPSRDELDGVLAEGEVVVEAPRDRRQGEVFRGQEELYAAVGIDEVIEESEVDIHGEASEEVEEVAVAAECIRERIRGVSSKCSPEGNGLLHNRWW